MIELYIEGEKVDVNEGFSTLISYAIDDVRDFAAKNTAFSKTVILPGTKNNNRLFGNIFNTSISNDYNASAPNIGINFNPSVSASMVLFQDNFQIIKGIAQMLEVVVDDGLIEYEIALFGELAGFVAKLGNKTLEDLDFSDYDHTYSIANITNSWDAAGNGYGYFYPLIDYGNVSADKINYFIKAFRPALFVKEYVDKIFENAGYTYDCDLFNTSRFKSLIIPHNQKTLTRLTSTLIDRYIAAEYAVLLHVDETDPQFNDNNSVSFPSGTTSSVFTGFQYTGADPINITLNITLAGRQAGGLDKEIFISKYNPASFSPPSIDANTVWPNVTNYQLIPGTSGPGDEQFYTYNQSVNLTMNQNDVFVIICRTAGGPASTGDSFYLYATTGTLKVTSSSAIPVEVLLGDTVQANQAIPKGIFQKDFFSSIVKLFQLYVYEDPTQDKVLKIAPFVDFFNLATSVNWDNKLDRSKPYRIKPMSELNARYYDFLYAEDSDYYNEIYKKRYNITYGSYRYDSAYEFAKETEAVELIFAGTPLVGYIGYDKVVSTIMEWDGKVVGENEETVDSVIRILQCKKIAPVTSWDIFDGTNNYPQTAYGYAGHFDDPDAPSNDLNFGVPEELFFELASGAINVNQFNLYWSSYMAEITDKDSRLLTGTFKLDYKDVANLDFSKLIHLDGSLYRINKIEDFNATTEDTCQCSLIKVINKIY